MKFLKKILEVPQKVVNSILLTIVYFIGIGISFILTKVMKKELFNLKKNKSYWKPYKKENKNYRMY